MSPNTIKFSQIAFAFEDATSVETSQAKPVETANEETANSVPQVLKEEKPVNIGVRVKALKEAVVKTLPDPIQPIVPLEEKIAVQTEELEQDLSETSTEEKTDAKGLEKIKSNRGRKSLKSMDADSEAVVIPADDVLFQKQYYSIGDVAEMFSVNTSLIRFWANEFDMVQPRKNRKGDRHFRPIDIKHLHLIHDLLRRRKLTIEGAKDFLKKNKKAQERFEMIEGLRKMRIFLQELKASLG